MADVAAIPVHEIPEKTSPETCQLRRTLTGSDLGNWKTIINEANNVILPNYLRASTGSCHDLCKHGRKHDSETADRTPMAKGSTPLPQSSLPRHAKPHILETKKEISSTCRDRLHGNQLASSRKSFNSNHSQVPKQRNLIIKESFDSKTGQSRQGNAGMMGEKKEASKTGQNNALVRTHAEATRNSKVVSKKTYSIPTNSSLSRNPGAQKKVSNDLTAGNMNAINSPAALNRSKTRKPADDARIVPKNKATMQQHSDHDEDIPEEKIIHVIETKTQKSDQLSSDPKENQTPSATLFPGVEGKDNSEDKDSSPHKLKFRKGKGIGIQSEKNTEGIRLKFKQPKLLNDQRRRENAEAKRKKSSREAADADLCEAHATRNEANEVVLRRQHPTQEKNTESSSNNVINETARKLVQTRKSKVKALVGAFETIISLHDDKAGVNMRD